MSTAGAGSLSNTQQLLAEMSNRQSEAKAGVVEEPKPNSQMSEDCSRSGKRYTEQFSFTFYFLLKQMSIQ